MIGISGRRSTIVQALLPMLPASEEVVYDSSELMPTACERYFLCAGVLHGKPIGDLTDDELEETWGVNFADVAEFLDCVIDRNPEARIVVMGSMSAEQGSYDMAYAGAKAALHLYVREKRLRYPAQQLVCIAPTIIEDSGMTQRRQDLDRTLERGRKRRRGQWIQSLEVARLVHFLLYQDTGAISNTVIPVTGGTW